MSEFFTSEKTGLGAEQEIESLLKGIDMQICLMGIIKEQLQTRLQTDRSSSGYVREQESKFGKSGYMADVELDENGEIASIRYDWVHL